MIASETIQNYLGRAFAATQRGIVGLTEQLLESFDRGDVEFERVGDRCVCRWTLHGETQVATAPLPPTAFRTILARIAVLCNEQIANSVSPYGGEGELTLKANPPKVVKVRFSNTLEKQKLQISMPTGPAVGTPEQEIGNFVTGRAANIVSTNPDADVGFKNQAVIPRQE